MTEEGSRNLEAHERMHRLGQQPRERDKLVRSFPFQTSLPTMSFYPKLETPSYEYKYLRQPYTAGIVGCPFR